MVGAWSRSDRNYWYSVGQGAYSAGITATPGPQRQAPSTSCTTTSFADTTGNVRLVADRPDPFVERQGASKDPWPSDDTLHSLKGRAAGRAVRALVDLTEESPMGLHRASGVPDRRPPVVVGRPAASGPRLLPPPQGLRPRHRDPSGGPAPWPQPAGRALSVLRGRRGSPDVRHCLAAPCPVPCRARSTYSTEKASSLAMIAAR